MCDDPTAVADLDVIAHTGGSEEYRHSWVVVYTPPDEASPAAEDGHTALVASETGPNVWRGTWTYDPDRVTRVRSYVRKRFRDC